ncbi:nucleolus and neural progenitor protein isoform X2 [Rhinatrema bivittatum]|nr:nucleolus and neural progenitor protein isoform X2 [Rhinatrema bivittatum]
MNLEGAVQDMLELCGRKPELQQGAQISVPSQPVLELVCLKILGGCKLLLRLLDCCCKTFHLSVQHLHLEEFIVLNLVIAGLVSRLWVMHQCILKRLASFYGPLFGLLQEVSRVHQMPYIHGFIFPSQIATFLGPAFSETKKKLPLTHSQRGATGLLSKLFSEQALSSVPAAAGIRAPLRKRKAPQMRLPGTRASDVGQPVLQSRRDKGTLPEFDVKTLRKRLKTSFCKDITSRIKCRDPKNSSRRSGAILSEQEKRSDRAVLLVLKIQMVQSFQELSEELRKVVVSCRSQRWTSEATFLGNTFLKCNRLKYVEALGYSLKRKLRCVKASIRKCLLHRQPRFYRRAGHSRIRSFLKASQKKRVNDDGRNPEVGFLCTVRLTAFSSSAQTFHKELMMLIYAGLQTKTLTWTVLPLSSPFREMWWKLVEYWDPKELPELRQIWMKMRSMIYLPQWVSDRTVFYGRV